MLTLRNALKLELAEEFRSQNETEKDFKVPSEALARWGKPFRQCRFLNSTPDGVVEWSSSSTEEFLRNQEALTL
jgi:hypothetical protein